MPANVQLLPTFGVLLAMGQLLDKLPVAHVALALETANATP